MNAISSIDYFSFPITEAERLDQVRLWDDMRGLAEEEKELRRKASEFLKAANAKKRQIKALEKRELPLKQKIDPDIYGVDQLSPKLQAGWKAHKAAGVPLTKEQAP